MTNDELRDAARKIAYQFVIPQIAPGLADAIAEYGRVVQERAKAEAQPAPLSADERAKVRKVLEPFAEMAAYYRDIPKSRVPLREEMYTAAELYQRLGEAGEPDTVAGSAALIRKLAERAGMTPSEFAKAFDALTPEQCRAAMKRGDT